VETAKKGGCPEDHLGIKNQIKKIPEFHGPSMKNININI
jgi:hypothetical protein